MNGLEALEVTAGDNDDDDEDDDSFRVREWFLRSQERATLL